MGKLEVSLAENQGFSRVALHLKTPRRIYCLASSGFQYASHPLAHGFGSPWTQSPSPIRILLPLSHMGSWVYIVLNHILKTNLSTSESLISHTKTFFSWKVNSQLWELSYDHLQGTLMRLPCLPPGSSFLVSFTFKQMVRVSPRSPLSPSLSVNTSEQWSSNVGK